MTIHKLSVPPLRYMKRPEEAADVPRLKQVRSQPLDNRHIAKVLTDLLASLRRSSTNETPSSPRIPLLANSTRPTVK